jgi:hypothetical protein
VQLAAHRAARAAALFAEGTASAEVSAALSPTLFRGGGFEIRAAGGGPRTSNEDEGRLFAGGRSNAAFAWRGMRSAFRSSTLVPGLPAGLGECVLRRGDTPSPYCRADGGYTLCGHPGN